MFFLNTGLWIVGDSHIKRAFRLARNRPGGPNINLDSLGWTVPVYWKGTGGAVIQDVAGMVECMLGSHQPPSGILIHVGGNNLVSTPTKVIHEMLLEMVGNCVAMLPVGTPLYLSHIFARPHYRDVESQAPFRRKLQLVNRDITRMATRSGGRAIRSNYIKPYQHTSFARDGVHLSDEGYSRFMQYIWEAMVFFDRNTYDYIF